MCHQICKQKPQKTNNQLDWLFLHKYMPRPEKFFYTYQMHRARATKLWGLILTFLCMDMMCPPTPFAGYNRKEDCIWRMPIFNLARISTSHLALNCISSQPSRIAGDTVNKLVIRDISTIRGFILAASFTSNN